jgi:hypothetical protein
MKLLRVFPRTNFFVLEIANSSCVGFSSFYFPETYFQQGGVEQAFRPAVQLCRNFGFSR